MTNSEIKELIYKILTIEMKKQGIKVEIQVTTRLENIFDILKTKITNTKNNKKEILLDIKDELIANKKCYAYYDLPTNKIKILIDAIKKDNYNEEILIWNIIKISFHEYKHVLIQHQPQNIESSFYINLENLIDVNDYFKMHDEIYEEIIADKYAIEKATQIIKPKYPTTLANKKLELNIKLEKILNSIYYQNYDIQYALDYINILIKDNNDPNLQKVNIIKILYNKDGTLKDINKLLQTNDSSPLPIKILYLIISTDTYLQNINYQKLSIEELKILIEAINYKYEIEYNKSISNEITRNQLEKLSEHVGLTDEHNIDLYIYTCQILNNKELINQSKVEKLYNLKKELTNKLNNHPKTKVKNKQREQNC